MEIKSIRYEKVFNLGNYSNEKIGIEITVAPGEDALDAFAEAKKTVEKSHQFFQDLPLYEKAKKVVSNPDDFTGREVKSSQNVIEVFEANYPEYINKFMPTSRQITQGKTDDDNDYDPNDEQEKEAEEKAVNGRVETAVLDPSDLPF